MFDIFNLLKGNNEEEQEAVVKIEERIYSFNSSKKAFNKNNGQYITSNLDNTTESINSIWIGSMEDYNILDQNEELDDNILYIIK